VYEKSVVPFSHNKSDLVQILCDQSVVLPIGLELSAVANESAVRSN
jgi:hypothetical protein